MDNRKILSYAGAGLSLGAAFGILFGMLLFENPWFGVLIGAALGAAVAVFAQLSRKPKDNK